MTKFAMLLVVCLSVSCLALKAQVVITGTIRNSATQETVPAVSVVLKGASDGDYTNENGYFRFTTRKKPPFTLTISSIGYQPKEIHVTGAQTTFVIQLTPASALGQEVVVSASRTLQKKLSSPVTIEQISNKDIINSPQLNYMDMVQGLKGVDVTVSSIGFTTITTRGFNTSGNTNFTQIVDGMDNQAPGLNFPLGNGISLTELDVDNVELLSGASSALYGSRGLNGALIMKGKDPFKYQGLSILITQGMNHLPAKNSGDPVGTSPYYDWTLRWAKKLSEKLAFKINFQYTAARDWVATDSTNKNGPGSKYTDPNYNGSNYYGGATSVDITPFLQGALQQDPSLAPIINPLLQNPTNYVARTGYGEYGYLDNHANLFKTNGEIRYKINPHTTATISGTFGTGNIVYSNDTRYQLKDFKVGQYRAEVVSDHWFIRTYTTQENSGNTLIAGPTAQLIDEAWSPSYNGNTGTGWYPDYTQGLLTAMAGGSGYQAASLAARAYADRNRPAAGSAYFDHLKDSISNTPITQGGTLFEDRSKLYNTEAQYNFSHYVKWVDIIAGLNWRLYNLNSKGTLFPDYAKPIGVNEYSAYVQLTKKVWNDKLSLSTSFRIDKNTLFSQPKVTSRASAVYQTGSESYLRFSYQNAYSFPSNIEALQNTLQGTNQYASGGSLTLLNGYYHFNQYPPYTQASVQSYINSGDADSLQKYAYSDIKPQSVNSFELGYSSLINKTILIDVLGYFSSWENFIGYTNVITPLGTTDVTALKSQSTSVLYNIAMNSPYLVNTYGYAASIGFQLPRNFQLKANFYSDFLHNRDTLQLNNFNTPSYHLNLNFGNTGFGPKQVWSFQTSMRYKPAYHYEVTGGLAEGTVSASAVFDAQLSYKLLKAHSFIKIGGTNVTNKFYATGVGNPNIGGVYYVSYAYNVF